MSLEIKIMEEIKTAMKNKDKVALEALRAVKSAILMAKTDGSGKELNEEDEIVLLQKQVKLRRDAAEQFSDMGRTEMAENENAQITVIEKFLPKQLSAEEIQAKVSEIISSLNAEGMKDMGKVMGVASSELAGKVDGKMLAEEVKKQLNS